MVLDVVAPPIGLGGHDGQETYTAPAASERTQTRRMFNNTAEKVEVIM